VGGGNDLVRWSAGAIVQAGEQDASATAGTQGGPVAKMTVFAILVAKRAVHKLRQYVPESGPEFALSAVPVDACGL